MNKHLKVIDLFCNSLNSSLGGYGLTPPTHYDYQYIPVAVYGVTIPTCARKGMLTVELLEKDKKERGKKLSYLP